MKFVLGPIPEDPTFDPDAFGWRSLKEPDPVALNFIALPVAGVMLGILLLFIRWFTTMRTGEVMGPLLIAFVVIIPIHESVHALLTPRFGTTSKTLLGCWPARILFYAYYEGEISRARFIVVLIGPTVMITVVPLLTIALFSLNAPWIASAAVANGIGSAGDLVGLFVMLSQIPRHAVV